MKITLILSTLAMSAFADTWVFSLVPTLSTYLIALQTCTPGGLGGKPGTCLKNWSEEGALACSWVSILTNMFVSSLT